MTPKLHILMLTEYFHPHARGGSEQSIYYLAQSLVKRGHKISLLTPNYGAPSEEIWHKIHILRFPIGKKLKPGEGNITPLWHTNLFWFLQTLIHLWKTVSTNKPDVIHIQGKYFLPAAIIVGKLTHLPVIFTARDYQIICNLGLCLWHKPKRCSLKEYIFSEIPDYLNLYLSYASPFRKIFQFLLFIRARLVTKILYWFAGLADVIICTSLAQQKIFQANGLKTLVIYNTVEFPKLVPARRRNQIVFAGRLTPGKGAHLLIPTFYKLQTRGYKLLIVGDDILKSKLTQQVNHYGLSASVKLLGRINHSQLMNLYGQSKIAISPSLWPESFGRSFLEAISQGTPIVTSNRGALPELVRNIYGLAVEPHPKNLAQALDHVIKHHRQFTAAITKDKSQLIHKFYTQPINQYEQIYSRYLS